jgi:hypothetical protein
MNFATKVRASILVIASIIVLGGYLPGFAGSRCPKSNGPAEECPPGAVACCDAQGHYHGCRDGRFGPALQCCQPGLTPPSGMNCPPNEVCDYQVNNGTCRCPSDKTVCKGACVDTDTDNKNCGGCGNVCITQGGHFCDGGKCGCPSSQTDCGGKCVITDRDPTHCGGCGYSCTTGQCVGGACTPTSAPLPPPGPGPPPPPPGPPGRPGGGGVILICTPDAPDKCDGRCVNISKDRTNCGQCGRSCNQGWSCIGGSCLQNIIHF